MGESVTPEQAEAIYIAERSRAFLEAREYTKPVVQRECDLKGWAAVIEAVRIETEHRVVAEFLDKGISSDRA